MTPASRTKHSNTRIAFKKDLTDFARALHHHAQSPCIRQACFVESMKFRMENRWHWDFRIPESEIHRFIEAASRPQATASGMALYIHKLTRSYMRSTPAFSM